MPSPFLAPFRLVPSGFYFHLNYKGQIYLFESYVRLLKQGSDLAVSQKWLQAEVGLAGVAEQLLAFRRV